MGVRATLAAITLTGGDTTQAETIGTDAKAQLTAALLKSMKPPKSCGNWWPTFSRRQATPATSRLSTHKLQR